MKNENTREMLEKTKAKIFETLAQVEHAPNVQMRQTPATLQPDSGDDDDEWEMDMRPNRGKRQHVAEFYYEDDASGDRIDTDQMGLCDFDDTPDGCSCNTACSCASSNPFMTTLNMDRFH